MLDRSLLLRSLQALNMAFFQTSLMQSDMRFTSSISVHPCVKDQFVTRQTVQ